MKENYNKELAEKLRREGYRVETPLSIQERLKLGIESIWPVRLIKWCCKKIK